MLDKKFREQIKQESETRILQQGWGISAWMAPMGDPDIRDVEEIKNRLSVLNAQSYLVHDLSVKQVGQWLKVRNKLNHLSRNEILLLRRVQKYGISSFELNQLHGCFDCIWTLLWLFCKVDDLPANKPPDDVRDLLPDLTKKDKNTLIEQLDQMRPIGDIYAMLDFYYRLHWFCVEQTKQGRKTGFPPELRVYQRRKTLEWVYNKACDWDNMLTVL